MNLIYEENTLTAEQFHMLREAVGFSKKEMLQLEKAIERGLYNIVVKKGKEVIGMGRLVGDGFMYWYVQDMYVKPQYQGLGIGKEIMRYLSEFVARNSLPNTTVTIGLMAAEGNHGFYEKLGYFARPAEGFGPGMMMFYEIPAKFP